MTITLVTLLVAAQAVAVPDTLDVHDTRTAIERPLSRGQEHRYRLTLAANECVSLIVEQHDLDVIAQVFDADADNGNGSDSGSGHDRGAIAQFQDDITTHGAEHIDIVSNADRITTYTLVIKPATASGAGSYTLRMAGTRSATRDDRDLFDVRTLRTAAAHLNDTGKLADARSLLERALAIVERVPGRDDGAIAPVAIQLGNVYLDTPDNAHAESMYERALQILDRDHPAAGWAQCRLAVVYERAGDRAKAEALLNRGLTISERALGPDHPQVVRCLVTLGNLHLDAGDHEKAAAIERRAIASLETLGETDGFLYADLLNNLGQIALDKASYDEAETLFTRSMHIGESHEGPDSYYVANALQNLGIVARERKDYTTAEQRYQRALAIRERIVGPEHADVASTLNNLANIYQLHGETAKSLETHFRALRIREKTVGPYHRGTLVSLGNIARTYAATGDMANAIAFQRRADAVIETQLGLNLALGAERQKLAFVEALAERTDRTISLNLDLAPHDPDTTALALLVLLQRKGRVLDAMSDTFATLRQRVDDPQDRDLLERWNRTTMRLAQLALNGQGRGEATIAQLEDEKEQLEAQLGARSAEFRARAQPVTLDAVQTAMPEHSVLVEFAVFRPFDPKADRNSDAYAAPHYAAYVLDKQGAPHGVDLGPASVIDDGIEALRRALRDPARRDVKVHARALHERVMRPLRAWLGGADISRLFISADGRLNLVPFDALVDERGRYLVATVAITSLTSGRDLLRLQLPRTNANAPVIIANPSFGEFSMTRDLGRLVGTEQEARAIKSLFPDATMLTGADATKAAVERLVAPRMLHIASHGFFARESRVSHDHDDQHERHDQLLDNPMLRSGLVLAGVQDAGTLTAMEAAGLNLWGTKLVTLSACDTGVGDVRNGEGVYGLRRAFVIAGAETLVMSLWPVSDYVTRKTMTAYYTGLRDGLGRGDALRRAKLAMLKGTAGRHPFRHPYYWASFIQAGQWASLDGRH